MLCATSVKNTNFLNGCNPEVKDTQGHSTTVFCKIAVRRRKYCLEFSITSGGLLLHDRSIHVQFSKLV